MAWNKLHIWREKRCITYLNTRPVVYYFMQILAVVNLIHVSLIGTAAF